MIFKQDLDDCYKTLISNIEDLSTLYTGWIMDNCEFGDDTDITFFQWAPIEDYADTDYFLIENTGTDTDDFDQSNCWDAGAAMGLSALRPWAEYGWHYAAQQQRKAQVANNSKNTKVRF